MRSVIQRVKEAEVRVDGKIYGKIGKGLLVFLGIGKEDTEKEAEWMVEKITNLRIFEDETGKLNHSLLDVKGELLIVSQFTLYAECIKGRRPSFTEAMEAEKAKILFDFFVDNARKKVGKVEKGVFQAHMDVFLINDGPVTIILESPKPSPLS